MGFRVLLDPLKLNILYLVMLVGPQLQEEVGA